MYQTLKIFEQAPIEDVDDQIAYCRYLTALELLSDGQAETISRSFPMFGEQAEISMDLEEAWKLVHGRGRNGVLNLDRVMSLPLNGSTFGTIAAEKNTAFGCEQYITASANYIRERENQPYPGRETVLEQLPYRYAGNRVFRGPEEFAARLRTNEVPPELNMTAADIDRRLQEIAQPYMDRNSGVLDPNLMSEADRQEYDCLNGAKTWHSTYIASAHIIDAYLEHNPTVYSFKQNLNMSDHFTVLARYTADPAFRSTVKQMTAFEQKAEMGFSFSEVRQHGEALLQSEQVRRASGGLYGAVKAVGSGDLSKKEQNKLVCRMIDAVNRNKGNLRAMVDPEKLDYKRIGKIPSIAYQLRHSQGKLVGDARRGKIVALMSGTTEMYRGLSAEQAADNQAIQKLRELYNELNVPNLEKRSKEYQSMVGAIGSVSAKTRLTPEDKLYVINAVEHYASEKRVVPSSENGKLSLNYGYEAIKAVAASPEAQETFLRPLEQNITRLQNVMLRKNLITEDRMIRLPEQEAPEEAQAGQNHEAVQPAGQHR